MRRAAAHPAGVVGGNSPDHGCIDGCRVGADFSAERDQIAVGQPPDDSGLKPDAVSIVQDFIVFPVAAGNDQDRIANGLAAKAGSGGPECDGDIISVGSFHNLRNFCFRFRLDNDFGNQAIEAGIGSVGQGAQGVCGQP